MINQFDNGLLMVEVSEDEMAPALGFSEKPFPPTLKEFKVATGAAMDHSFKDQKPSIDPSLHGVIYINLAGKQVLLYTPMRIEHPVSHAAILMMLRKRKEIDDSQDWIVCCRDAVWGKTENINPATSSVIKLALECNPTWGFMLVDYQEGACLEQKFNGKDNISFYWMGDTLAYADRVFAGDRNLEWELHWPAGGKMKDQPKEQVAVLKAQLLVLIDKFACPRLTYTATTPFVLRDFPSLGVMLIPDPAGQKLEFIIGVDGHEGCVDIRFGETEMGWIYWNSRNELDVEWRMPDSVCSDTIKAQLLTIVKNGELYPTQPF